MSRALLALAFALTITPAAAQGPAKPNAAMLVSVSELAAQLKNPDIVVLHVADRAAAYEEGHIPGARFLRYADFAIEGADGVGSELPAPADIKRVLEAVGVSDNSRVVLYAANAVYAARAFFTLDAYGHTRVAVLDGGLNAWRNAKQALETGSGTAAKAGSFTPRLNAQRVATAAQIQQQMPAKGISLVDVRPDPEFTGSDGGMGGRHAAGHIDGAQQLHLELARQRRRHLPPARSVEGAARRRRRPTRPAGCRLLHGRHARLGRLFHVAISRLRRPPLRRLDHGLVQKKLPVKAGKIGFDFSQFPVSSGQFRGHLGCSDR